MYRYEINFTMIYILHESTIVKSTWGRSVQIFDFIYGYSLHQPLKKYMLKWENCLTYTK